MRILITLVFTTILMLITSCSKGTIQTYQDPKPVSRGTLYQKGVASWYGPKFHGRKTANGEIYNMNILTAAHKQLPFNTFVEVKNRNNNRKVIVRINDRGPFVNNRIIDLSKKAARRIGMVETGTAPVELRIVKAGNYKVSTTHPTTDRKAGFFIQAGAFGDPDNARRYLKRINSLLPDLKFRLVRSDRIVRITSASFKSRSFVKKACETLRENGIDCILRESY